jgi:hypothetical protein
MKWKILTVADGNMAGYSWRWNFYLEDKKVGGYTLNCEVLDCEEIDTEHESTTIEPVAGLRHGADVYDALDTMLSEATGYRLDETELATKAAAEIAKLNANLADQFKRGPEILERRHAAAARKADAQRDAKLGPYRAIIDEYVMKFSDAPLRFPGGFASYGTQRLWAKRFIEQFVIDNGQLPDGEHNINFKVGGTGYSGAPHDFSDLKLKLTGPNVRRRRSSS